MVQAKGKLDEQNCITDMSESEHSMAHDAVTLNTTTQERGYSR